MFRPGKPMPATVFTVHSSYPNYKLRNRLLLIPVFAFFGKVVCCSKASYDSFPAFYRWFAGSRLGYIPNGVDIDRLDGVVGKQQRYTRKGAFTIVAVGRLIEPKNPICILKAFQQSAEQGGRLVYIGEGPLREELLTELEERGLGKQVELCGLIPRDEVYENLTQADLFISASHVEGLPVAVLEAMACRCPVILSDIPSHREIADGIDFVPLIHPDDVMGFAREIRRF
jgi:glycosyltransferase involved in cell wall biosynthesis